MKKLWGASVQLGRRRWVRWTRRREKKQKTRWLREDRWSLVREAGYSDRCQASHRERKLLGYSIPAAVKKGVSIPRSFRHFIEKD